MYLLKHFYIVDAANNTANNFNYKQLLMFENKIKYLVLYVGIRGDFL